MCCWVRSSSEYAGGERVLDVYGRCARVSGQRCLLLLLLRWYQWVYDIFPSAENQRLSRSLVPMSAFDMLIPLDLYSETSTLTIQGSVEDVIRAVRMSNALGLCLSARGSIFGSRVLRMRMLTRPDCIATSAVCECSSGILDFDEAVIAHTTDGTTRQMSMLRRSTLSGNGSTMTSIFNPCDRKNGGYGTMCLLRSSWSQVQHILQQDYCTALIHRMVAKSMLDFGQSPFQAIP